MGTLLDELEKQARALTREEKASLARTLIEQLDSSTDPNADQLWLDEAQRRYDAFKRGEMSSVFGDEAMARARSRLK